MAQFAKRVDSDTREYLERLAERCGYKHVAVRQTTTGYFITGEFHGKKLKDAKMGADRIAAKRFLRESVC